MVHPVLPAKFYGEWSMYYYPFSRVEPPNWGAGRARPPGAKYSAGRVWYDFANQRAIEHYDSICVPIFRPDNYFGCLQHEVRQRPSTRDRLCVLYSVQQSDGAK